MKSKKKILIGLAVLFSLLVVAVAVLPFMIDVDKYRPEIVAKANEKINGKLSIGKMQLSLWGQIRVNVDGIELFDSNGGKVLGVKDVFFHIPFSSLFSGSPLLTLKLNSPQVWVMKNKEGKMNLMEIAKSEPAAVQTTPPASAEKTSPSSPKELPAMAKKARFGIEILHADVNYQDVTTATTSQVKDLNILIKDLSIERPSEIEFWANLETQVGKTLSVTGPVKATAKITPKFNGTEFQEASVDAKATMDDVVISMPGLFEKKKGIPANLTSRLSVTNHSALVHQLDIAFFNAKVEGKASAENWDNDGTLTLDLKSNEIDLKPWAELVPMLKEYDLKGTAHFNADAHGKMSSPQYRFEAFVKDFIAKAPKVKGEPKMQVHVKVVTDKLEDFSVVMQAPGNHLEMKVVAENFKKPKVDIRVASSGLDLDTIMDLPKEPAKAADSKAGKDAPKEPAKAAQTAGKPAGEEDMDVLLEPLRTNEAAKNMTVNISAKMASLKAYDVKLTDLNLAMGMKNLNVAIDNAGFKLWEGQFSAKMDMQLAPKTPTYHFNTKIAGLNIQKAVESSFALFKNTLLGKATFNIEGTGQSFTTLKAKRNLNAKGSMNIAEAKFATIDIAKVLGDGVNKAIAEKLPQLKDKKITVPSDTESKYTSMTSDFTIQNGVFNAPNFFAKAESGKGIDVKGSTSYGLLDSTIKANWELIDTYNLTHAKELSVEQSGVRVEHILTDGNEPLKIPVGVEGSTAAPQFLYTGALEALSKVVLKNVGNAVAERAKGEARKQIQEASQKALKQASPDLQNAVKNLGGKLFGN